MRVLRFNAGLSFRCEKSNIDMDVEDKEMELLSNSIAAYAHIKGGSEVRGHGMHPLSLISKETFSFSIAANPESFGLYFVLGVCFGLVLTLCLLVIRISCKPQTKMASTTLEKKHLKDIAERVDESAEEEDEDGEDAEAPIPSPSTDVPVSNHTSQSDGTLSVNVFTSAEELERAQRLEERERIIREIWRNGQPDILGTGTGTIGRVHYY